MWGFFLISNLLVIAAVILVADWIGVGLEISIWGKEKFLDITSVLEMLLLSEKHSRLYKFSTV